MTGAPDLSDYCELVSQQINPADIDPAVVCLGLENLGPGRMRPISFGRASDVQSNKYVFQAGDVLYSKLRPYLDKAVLAETDGVCTTELLVFRPKPGVDPRFLACLVHAPEFVEHAMSGVTGAHHPRTSWVHVSRFPVLYQDKGEQRGIGNFLWHVHDRLTACGHAEQIAQDLKRAATRELFMRGLHGKPQKETEIGLVPDNWNVVDFGTVREWLQYGTSIHCSKEPKKNPVLRIPNVGNGRVDSNDLKYCDMPSGEADNYLLEDGDLLFIRTNGVLERLGSCAVYEGDPERALFASYLIRARLKPGIEPRYVAHFYGSQIGTSLIAGRATPAADGKFNLNTGIIDSLPLPLPTTVEEQREIITILDSIDCKIDRHRKKRSVLEDLFKSLLSKLMKGEIRLDQMDMSALVPPESKTAVASVVGDCQP